MQTKFSSLKNYQKGTIEIFNDNPKNYAFSNLFDVAEKSKPYEKIVVAKNFKYVIEVVRVEGDSPWYICSHDEFALIMDGSVQLKFMELSSPPVLVDQGSHILNQTPSGKLIGTVFASNGHMVLLPKNTAYQILTSKTGVILIQTILGKHSLEKWREICMNDSFNQQQ